MTVSKINPVNNYAGDSSVTRFDFDFLIEDEKELLVQHTNSLGVQSTLTLDVDYSINEIGNKNGSYINFPLAGSSYSVLAEDEIISLSLELDIEQDKEYANSSKLNLITLEWSLDYIVRILQTMSRKIARSVKVQEGSSTSADEFFQEFKDDVNNAVETAKGDISASMETFKGEVEHELLNENDGIFTVFKNQLNTSVSDFKTQVNSTISTVNEAASKINQMETSVQTCVESAETAQEAAQRAQFYTNMQADWSQDDPTQKDYIKNKPISNNYGLPIGNCSECDFYYDETNSRFCLTWADPENITADGVALAEWEKTVIVAKKGSYPTSLSDGQVIETETVRNSHLTTPLIFNTSQKNYYFRAFPITKGNLVNNSEENNFIDYEVYTFSKHLDESNPDSRITYSGKNANYSPAYMNFSSDTFNYGSWANAFFLSEEWLTPCMVYNAASGRNGEVAYFLNKNDYTKQINGTGSGITDLTLNMNAMMRIKTIWFKRTLDRENNVVTVNIASKQADDSYKPYGGFIKPDGSVREYIYLPIYQGYNNSSKLMSISGKTSTGEVSITNFRTYAKANGDGWDLCTWSDKQMLQDLFMLMCKSTDCQSKIGRGNCDQSSATYIAEGTLNAKGLFYGKNDGKSAVKFFGMENLWGNKNEFILGLVGKSGRWYYKACQGTSDGSSASDYSLTSVDGYNVVHENAVTSNITSYNQGYPIEGVGEFINTTTLGSDTTYDCDYQYISNSSTMYFAFVGGFSTTGSTDGLFRCYVNSSAPNTNAYLGAAVSYKPL